MEFIHKSVLLNEVIENLNIKKDGIYVDGTLGKGGHSKEIVKRLETGLLIGIDQDEAAIEAASENLSEYKDNTKIVRNNFANVKDVLEELNIDKIDGFLLDLGVSSYQFDEAERGFSYRFDAKLDMRMDKRNSISAWNIVNEYSQEDLSKIIWEYSDERWAKRIAEFIVEERKIKKIDTTFELVEIIKKAIPLSARKDGGHPAKRTFQAIRMEVNGELNKINKALREIMPFLKKGARVCVITFHSVEDSLVKNIFKELENPCICPRDFPICNCGKKSLIKIVKPAVITASEEELADNSRAKSAKLRTVERKG